MSDFVTKVIGSEWFQYLLYMTLLCVLALAAYPAIMVLIPGLMSDSIKEDIVEYILHYVFG